MRTTCHGREPAHTRGWRWGQGAHTSAELMDRRYQGTAYRRGSLGRSRSDNFLWPLRSRRPERRGNCLFAPVGARLAACSRWHCPCIGTCMVVAARAGYVWLLVAALAAGCGGVRVPAGTPPHRVSQRLEEAETLARVGRYTEARETYAMVLVEHGAPSGAERALLGLARLALDPKNPNKDERQAAVYLDRLLMEYPESHWAPERGPGEASWGASNACSGRFDGTSKTWTGCAETY